MILGIRESLHKSLKRGLLGLLIVGFLGCQSLENYEADLNQVTDSARVGDISRALKIHDEVNDGKNDLLYLLESGELSLLSGHDREALDFWLEANKKVMQWESRARLEPRLLAEDLGSIVVNDKVRTYQGYDFEKVMLTCRIALSHLLAGDLESSRVAIKASHERESLISKFREEQMTLINREENQSQLKIEDLNGYPIETLEHDSVNSLRNSYQNAFAHYLAGFIYEQLNELSLAAPGYRNAIELKPNEIMLRDGLKSLEKRVERKPQDGFTDLLVIFEQDYVPSKTSIELFATFDDGDGSIQVPFSFPVYGEYQPVKVSEVLMDGVPLLFSPSVIDFDAMARRALRDEIPAILARSGLRTGLKVTLQSVAREVDDTGLVSEILGLGSIISESADDRSWRMLPRHIGLVRELVPYGTRVLEFEAGGGQYRDTIEIVAESRAMVLFVRRIGPTFYFSKVSFK